MDRLVVEKEVEKEVQKEEIKVEPHSIETNVQQKSYIDSFENKTLGDFKKEREEKEIAQFKEEKEVLIEQQFETKQTVSQNIIEKPNYDLIEENKKIVRIKKKENKKPKSNKKLAGVMLACTLGVTALICVTNSILIDNLNSSYLEIDETYNVNLQRYLKNIQNLDATKKSMEIVETYPEELLDAGDAGQKSNWFDRLCNFLGGLFGG